MLSRMAEAQYKLYYWPMIQGRGEFVRLVLEDADQDYVDVARLPEAEGGGVPALQSVVAATPFGFAPPILKHGEHTVCQTLQICAFLSERHCRVPDAEEGRRAANHLAGTLYDFAVEIHNVHHPLGASLYYEEQRAESLRAAAAFFEHRLPKFLGFFERCLDDNGGAHPWLLGSELSYPDLWLFQVVEGLTYAFPATMAKRIGTYPKLRAMGEACRSRPRLADYLQSERRIPFNEHGLFRHYPELDVG
jgi:glutathione S-transferase